MSRTNSPLAIPESDKIEVGEKVYSKIVPGYVPVKVRIGSVHIDQNR